MSSSCSPAASDLVARCQASADEEGLVGNNRTGVFVADEQREAMDGLVAGLALKHDNYVERCWPCRHGDLRSANARRRFYRERRLKPHAFLDGWSNHALYLLANSPRYGRTTRARSRLCCPKCRGRWITSPSTARPNCRMIIRVLTGP